MFWKRKASKVVPVINLKGVIQAGGRSPFQDQANLNIDNCRASIKAAFNTAGAVAVALDINCPGGSPTQSELIGNLIRELAEKKNIPVYAFAQDVAASGGYWLACAADKIFAANTSMVGSIGVVTQGYGVQDLAAKAGVEERTFTAGEAKRRMSAFEKPSDEDKAWLQSRLDTMHEIFIDWVKERRHGKLTKSEKASELFTGDTWFGKEAKELGLIDGIGELESTMKAELGDDIKIKRPRTKRRGLLSSLMSFQRASAQQGNALENVSSAAVHSAHDVIKSEAIWAPYDMK